MRRGRTPGLDSGAIVRAVQEITPIAKQMSIYPTIYRLRGVRIFKRGGRYYPTNAAKNRKKEAPRMNTPDVLSLESLDKGEQKIVDLRIWLLQMARTAESSAQEWRPSTLSDALRDLQATCEDTARKLAEHLAAIQAAR